MSGAFLLALHDGVCNCLQMCVTQLLECTGAGEMSVICLGYVGVCICSVCMYRKCMDHQILGGAWGGGYFFIGWGVGRWKGERWGGFGAGGERTAKSGTDRQM